MINKGYNGDNGYIANNRPKHPSVRYNEVRKVKNIAGKWGRNNLYLLKVLYS
jgi:hypothetical protein